MPGEELAHPHRPLALGLDLHYLEDAVSGGDPQPIAGGFEDRARRAPSHMRRHLGSVEDESLLR